MPDLHFTKAAILELPVPERGKRAWYHDSHTRYLALRTFPTGKRTFYHYRWIAGKPQQTKLGDFPEMTIDQARRRVAVLNGEVVQGHDPSAERLNAREEWTFADLALWYEANYSQRKKTGGRDRRHLELYFPELFPLNLSAVSRVQVRQLHAKRGHVAPSGIQWGGKKAAGAYSANRALALLRAVFARAIEDEVFAGANPADGVRAHPEQSRERRLDAREIEALFLVLDKTEPAIRDYVLLSLMTGARKANLLAMRWDEVNIEAGEWRVPMTKNGRALIIPLEAQERNLLARRRKYTPGEWVFPGRVDGSTGHMVTPTKGWKRVLTEAGIQDFRLHDLRRTLGSLMADSGASLHVIGKALGHKSQAATLVYARLSLDPVREAKRGAMEAMERRPVNPKPVPEIGSDWT